MAKYGKNLNELSNVTSTNNGFRTVHHSVATYDQTINELSYLYLKEIVDVDGIRTRPLNFQTNLFCTVFLIKKYNCKTIVSIYITCHSFKLLSN